MLAFQASHPTNLKFFKRTLFGLCISFSQFEGCSWLKVPWPPVHRSTFADFCQSSFFFSFFCSFLADLMDNSELIRNVTLCGHLHHGKVSPTAPGSPRGPQSYGFGDLGSGGCKSWWVGPGSPQGRWGNLSPLVPEPVSTSESTRGVESQPSS